MAANCAEDSTTTSGGNHHRYQPNALASMHKQSSILQRQHNVCDDIIELETSELGDVESSQLTTAHDHSTSAVPSRSVGTLPKAIIKSSTSPEFQSHSPIKGETKVTRNRGRTESSPAVQMTGSQKKGWKPNENLCNVLSILYAVFVMVLGVAFPMAEMFGTGADLHVGSFEGFYVYLFIVSIAFLLYVQFFIVQKREVTLYVRLRRKFSQLWARCTGHGSRKSTSEVFISEQIAMTSSNRASDFDRQMSSFQNHAATGSFYLRLGAVAFGVGGMILDGLQFGLFIESQTYEGCVVPTADMLRPITQLIFTFLQMYFIFRNSKLYIHAHRIAGRFGLMHMVATNMCVWFRVCTMETIHELHHLMPHEGGHGHGGGDHGDSGHDVDHHQAAVEHVALDHHATDSHRHRRGAAPHHGVLPAAAVVNATADVLNELKAAVHENVTALMNALAHGAHDILSGGGSGHHGVYDPRHPVDGMHAAGLDSHGTVAHSLDGHSVDGGGHGGGHSSGGLCEGLSETLTEAVNSVTPYLYACTVEYSLIGAGVMYLIWLNVGRHESADSHHQPQQHVEQDHHHHHHHHHHDSHHHDDHHHHHDDHSHGHGHHNHHGHGHHGQGHHSQGHVQNFSFNCSKATIGLFFGIFVLIGTIICIIVFFAMLNRDDESGALTTSYPVMYIIEIVLYALSIIAIVGAVHGLRHLTFHKELHCELDEILLLVALVGVYTFCMFSILCGINQPGSPLAALVTLTTFLILIQSTLQTLFILNGLRRSAENESHVINMPGRQYLTFLIVSNISLWAVNSFLVLRSESNPVAVAFYGQLPWSIVTHASMPLAIFYRFHSTVCLVDIWKDAYKIKEHHH